MKRTRTIWLYTLLLLLPTLIVAGVLWRLLVHERERMAQAGELAAVEQARGVASQIVVAVQGVKARVEQQLAALPEDDKNASLAAWERRDPLIRNVFIIDDARGVLLPDGASGLTGEEQAFLQRFAALFEGRDSWQIGSEPDRVEPEYREPILGKSRRGPSIRTLNVRPLMTQNLDAAPSRRSTSGETTGIEWLPWFSGRSLYLLAWRRMPGGLRCGVEIETIRLLAGIITAFPERLSVGQTLTLLDGQGAVMHSVGAKEFDPADPLLADISLAPALPHWRLVVAGNGADITSRGLLFLLATVLCGILILTILSGGWVLLRDSQRNATEARAKTSFVANVSHELKTPLTTIRMYAELLEEGRARDEAKRSHYLGVIVQESQRLTRLINNVLDFSRLEQGRKTYRPEPLDLAAETQRIVEAQRERLEGAGLTVSMQRSEDSSCGVVADRDAFEQSLLNVLDNAAKYGATGLRLGIQIVCDATHAAVRVSDRGPGIPAAHRTRLFQQFHRVDDSLTTRQPGCGLGLSISRRLLRDQGGDLEYESAEGGGACFVLTLPRTMEVGDESTARIGS